MWSSSLTAKLSRSRVMPRSTWPWILSRTLRSSRFEAGVGVRLVDDGGRSVGGDVEELAPIAAGGDVDDDVEILAGRVERALDAGVEQVETISCCGSPRLRSSGGRPASHA